MKTTLAIIATATMTQAKLSGDFVTGFETGIFLRDDE